MPALYDAREEELWKIKTEISGKLVKVLFDVVAASKVDQTPPIIPRKLFLESLISDFAAVALNLYK